MIGSIVFICVGNIIMLPIIIVFMIMFVYLYYLFLKVAIETNRLRLMSFSPIISSIIEYNNGLAYYRIFN